MLTSGIAVLLALLLSSAASLPVDPMAKFRRTLAQATATAVANADSNGGTADASSTAGAVSTGPPASSTVISNATAGPGETVVAKCSGVAVNTQEYKVCVGSPRPPRPPRRPRPSPNPEAVIVWASAPKCVQKPPSASSLADAQGRLWDFEDGVNCVYRTATGAPVTAANIGLADLSPTRR